MIGLLLRAADAPPFGDLMDISAEAAAFDPDGEFVRRWLPVLARLPSAYLHAPWTAPQVGDPTAGLAATTLSLKHCRLQSMTRCSRGGGGSAYDLLASRLLVWHC